jgi:hypothetical protein
MNQLNSALGFGSGGGDGSTTPRAAAAGNANKGADDTSNAEGESMLTLGADGMP